MLNMKAIIMVLFSVFAFIFQSFGQPELVSTPEYSFSRIKLSEIHRQFFIEDILRDSTGFMWFATRDGLYRYDGVTLRLFQSNMNDPTSLQSNNINGLCLDKAKKLWVVTGNCLYRYNELLESFTAWQLPKSEDNSEGNNLLCRVMSDNNQKIWIATWDRGLLQFDPKTSKFRQYGKKIFGTNTVRAIIQDRMNTIWVASHNGLFIYNPQNDAFEEFSYLKTKAPSREFSQLNTLYEDKQGVIWIGSNNGIIKFERLSASISFLPVDPYVDRNDKNIVECFYDDNRDRIWVGTRNGLNIFSKSQNRIILTIYGDKKDENGLISSDIRRLYDDKRGNLWIGTHNGGVNKYSLLKKAFKTAVINSDEIGDNRVFSVFQSANQDLWLGTENGLYLLNPETSKIKSFNSIPVLRSVLVSGIIEDKAGNIWIGTDKDGLIMLNPKTLATRQLLFNNEKPASFSTNDIWEIYYDSKGRIWICKSGNGLVCYDPSTNTSVTYTNNPLDASSISSNSIGYILEDKKGGFWIGTSVQGLNYLNPKTGKFDRFFHNENNTNSLLDNSISSLHIDRENNLWVGTSEGLDKLNTETGIFEHFGEKDGLDVLLIQAISEDKAGNIWVSTTNGIFKRDRISGKFKKYTSADGLPSDQFLPGSLYKNNKGTIYMGTEAGLVYFDPSQIENNPYVPNVILTNFKLFNKNVAIGDILTQSIVSIPELNLSYKDNYLMFEFASLDYQNPGKNKYTWYLEGLEKTWNNPVFQNTAVYNNLAPGKYTLKIKASNNDDVWNEKGYEIKIHIDPPFYLTVWFKILFVILVICLIFAYNYLRIRKIRNRNIILEKTVEKRTQTINIQKEALEKANQDLSDQKDEIISQSNQLKENNSSLQEQQEKIKLQTLRLQELDKVKTQFFTNISHEFRTPLTLIIGPLEKLLKENTSELLKRQYEVMLRNSHRLLRLINQLLDLSSLDAGHLKLMVTKGNISEYLRNISDTFTSRAERQNIYYQYDVSAISITGYFDYDKVEKIVYNLLSNAFKNTPDGGSIVLSVQQEMIVSNVFHSNDEISGIVVRVADTGIGIPSNLQGHIFDRFYRVENNSNNSNPGAGIGLSLTKELVLAHYGSISVISEQGKGAEFIVILPIDLCCFSESEISDTPNTHTEANLKALQIIESAGFNQNSLQVSIDYDTINERPLLLIIEDDKDLNEFLVNHYSEEYRVISAYNGTEGLNTALDSLPDLILSDIMLPGDDGITISRILKTNELTSHIPIILLTAKDTESEKISGFETGADDYITKPFEISLLDIRIKNLIDQRKKLMERFSRIVTLQPTNIKVNKPDENFLQKAMDIIEKNMENPSFDVELFTREIGMSRTLLYRKVRALTDQSINDFIRSVRLKRAAQFLQSGTFNVNEAAIRAGFTNQSYFSKCFEQQFGELPSKYASRYKTN